MLTVDESRIVDVAIRHLAYSWDHTFTTELDNGYVHERGCGFDISEEGKRSALAALVVLRKFHKNDNDLCAKIDAVSVKLRGMG
jgi:hypothetical protein